MICCKAEWNESHGFELQGSSNYSFTACRTDRNYAYGYYAHDGSGLLSFDGCLAWRDGRQGGSSYAGFAFIGKSGTLVGPVILNGCVTRPGSDGGGDAEGPQYGITYGYVNMIAVDGVFWGFQSGKYDQGGNTRARISANTIVGSGHAGSVTWEGWNQSQNLVGPNDTTELLTVERYWEPGTRRWGVTGKGVHRLQEVDGTPSNPAADNVLYYAEDDGAGKTRIVALFSDGTTRVMAAQAAGPVSSVFGRTGAVTAQSGDYTAAQVTNAESTANKDTDTALAANSDTKYPSQKAVKAYIDGLLAASDAVVYKGVKDCSANPNYPAADAGHLYRVSVAGKIGGASGVNVEVGDTLLCLNDGTASGDQATVGSKWNVIQVNIDGALVGPSSATDADIAVYNGTTGKIVKDGGKTVVQVLARANHTGTQLSSTVSDFDTQVRTSRLDQMAAPTADVSANSHKLTKVSDPTATDDAANKKYVDAATPWNIDINPILKPATQSGWADVVKDDNQLMNGQLQSDGAQNRSVGWDITLGAGTWDFTLLCTTNSNQGIVTVSFDGVSVGTIDLYSAALTQNVLKSITGISVASTAKVRLLLKMATKNASSSSYYGVISALGLRRTA